MKTYNAGLIGFGYWGKILHKYLTKHKGFSLKAIATRHPESIAGVIPSGVKACTIEELAGDPEIDAVFIATPIITHYEITRLCLEQGKHVFCEKPLTSVYFEAQHLKEISGKTGRHLFTDYIYTFSPLQNQEK
jgi:predicted dehydrogenase